MSTEQDLQSSLASIVEDVLQQQGTQWNQLDFYSMVNSRKVEEASLRRNEAARWLRKMAGVVLGKDLPAEPSEEEFRLGLRSGIILCNVLNKVRPGSIPKVVERPGDDSVLIPDGNALYAFQYFENVRNFLVAMEELRIPTFEVSDLEHGGKSSRIVNCVLALKSYSEWIQNGAIGTWKYAANTKLAPSGPGSVGKQFVRKNSEPFMNSYTKLLSQKSVDSLFSEQSEISEADAATNPMCSLVRAALLDKKPEEIPIAVESMLKKVVEEFERRLLSQNELIKAIQKDVGASSHKTSLSSSRNTSPDPKAEVDGPLEVEVSSEVEDEEEPSKVEDETSTNKWSEDESSTKIEENMECDKQMLIEQQRRDCDEESKAHLMKQKMLVDQNHQGVQELKHTLRETKEGLQILKMKCSEEFHVLGKHLHSLAHAASGYQRVLEENRKLYNQLQDLKGNIRVYCRVRPFLGGQNSRLGTVVDNIDDGNVSISTHSKYGKDGRKSFSFNKVFGPSATQADVFSDTQPLIRSVLDGYNVCIFAYGQTGSGKTYTMTGPKELNEETLGVNYRALSDLFYLSKQRRDTISYEISVQMLEIYNEQVRDLLVTDGLNKKLEIRNSSNNGFNVPDANLIPVSSTSDVMNLMNLGSKNRAVSATAMNDLSSRSHSCLTVHVQGRDLTSGAILRGSMHLVDLAGSERVEKSEVTGDRLKEAVHINKSLSALGDVIASLAQRSPHVPYRNSKLTQLLQDSLGGQAKTLMFVHISPEFEALGETLSTLKFAERVATVELGAAKVNKDTGEVKELKEQIASLKSALARKEGDEPSSHSRTSSPERTRTRRGVSPLRPKSQSTGDSISRRQSLDNCSRRQSLDNATTEIDSSSTSRRHSLDLQELSTQSLSWPRSESSALSAKDDDRESVSSDCVDKVMVNTFENSKYESLEPEKLCKSGIPVLSKILSDPNMKRKDSPVTDLQRLRYEFAATDDSDHEATTTSDCSETDSLWQSNIPKISYIPNGTNIPNGIGPKAKKSILKSTKSLDTRSSIPSLSSSMQARKATNGVNSNVHKAGRQQVAVDGRRKNAHSK